MMSTEDPVLHVGYVHGRVQPCLFVTHAGEAHPLAYFRSEEAAELAARLIKNGWSRIVFDDADMRELVGDYARQEADDGS